MMKSETTPAKQPPAKMPRAKILWISPEVIAGAKPTQKQARSQLPVALIPCATPKQAAALVKWHRLTREGKIDALAYSGLWKICGFRSNEVAEIILNLTEPNA